MHGLCAEGDGNATHLAKCPRDFVEAPSQMLENWCWQPAVLARLSRHHETGAPLPGRLVESMIRAKNVHESLFMLRQIVSGWHPVHHIFFSIACRINRTNVEKRPNLLLTHGQVL
jgi:Zn-dependent oligopeptidase